MRSLFFLSLISTQLVAQYVDFDTSMQVSRYTTKINTAAKNRVLTFFKTQYQLHNIGNTPEGVLHIPKLLHFIWFGGNVPQEYARYQVSWYMHHSQWPVIWWVDMPEQFPDAPVAHSWEEVTHLLESGEQFIVVDVDDLSFEERPFFELAMNHAERSDILRYRILYELGGVYLDTDFECVKPLDTLHYRFDFYIGIQPLDTITVQLGTGLIAAIPKHPILKHTLETLAQDQQYQQIVLKTGPIHFTKSFIAVANKYDTVDCALPASYFYPCGYNEQEQPCIELLKPESFAIHWWMGSWLKPEAFVKELR